MPLPPELLEQIRKNIRESEEAIKILKPEIEKAKLAGIDVADQLKVLKELEKKVADLRVQYGK